MSTLPAPFWQTDELAEEWPDSDSSPSASASTSRGANNHDTALSPSGHQRTQNTTKGKTPEEIEAMYGSIKYLGSGRGQNGHPNRGAGPTGLMGMMSKGGRDSGKSVGIGMGMRIVSGDVSFETEHQRQGRNERYSHEGEGIPSPPSSGSESGTGNNKGKQPSITADADIGTQSTAPAGTFLVRPTSTPSTTDPSANQSDAPAFLAKVRAAAAGGGAGGEGKNNGPGGGGVRGLGIFEPLAIERMFEPPTPPRASAPPNEREQVEEEPKEPQDERHDRLAPPDQDARILSNGLSGTGTLGTMTTKSTASSATARSYGDSLSRSTTSNGQKRSRPTMPMTTSPEGLEPSREASPDVERENVPLRRTSHGFVPRRPSRLSESMTPPSPGASTHSGRSSPVDHNLSGTGGERSFRSEEERSDVRVRGGPDLGAASGAGRMRIFSGRRDSMDNVGFTFSPSPPPPSAGSVRAQQRRTPNSIPVAASPFQTAPLTRSGDAPVARPEDPKQQSQPPRALKLFQRKYDTYTRDHVSELVDKLSVGGTPVQKLAERSAARRARNGLRSQMGVEVAAADVQDGERSRLISGGQRRGRWVRNRKRETSHSSGGSGSVSASGSGSGSSGMSGSPAGESGFDGGESSEDDRSMMERNLKRIRLSEPLEGDSHAQSESIWSSPRSGEQEQSGGTSSDRSLTPFESQPTRQHRPINMAASAVAMAAAASSYKLGQTTNNKGDRRSWGEKGEDLLQKIKQKGFGSSPSVSSVTDSSAGMEGNSKTPGTMRSNSDLEDSTSQSSVRYVNLAPTPTMQFSRMAAAPALPQRAPAMLSIPAQANAAPRATSRQQSGTVNSAHSGGSAQTSGGGTSSGSGTITSHYIINGRDIMDRIKQRKVSESSGTATGGEAGERPLNLALAGRKGKEREVQDDGLPSPPVHVVVTDASVRPGSVASSRITVSRCIDTLAPAAVEDVNQYISSASTVTNTVGTAMSTSFVKHRGPPSPPPPGGAKRITRLAPHQVPSLGAPQGKMVYDAKAMSWVKVSGAHARLRQASTAEGSSSSGSEDVFAGMESLREESLGPRACDVAQTAPDVELYADEQSDQYDSGGSNRPDEEDDKASISTGSIAVIPAESESPSFVTQDASTPAQKVAESQPRVHLQPAVMEVIRPLFKTVHSAPTPLENPGTPRSALKAAGAPGSAIKKTVNIGSVTPARANDSSPGSSLRRSVSFVESQGDLRARAGCRSEGKPRKRSSTPARTITDRDVFDEHMRRSGDLQQAVAPSARTRRISNMLDDLDVAAETPSRPSSGRHVRKMSDSYALTEEHLTADTTIEGLSGFYARLRPSGSTNRNLADATFLTECSFGVAHDKLVEIITEVQPFEPHWEELTRIDLSKRGATSVARLKEFLPKLDEANLNDNEISYLSGVPSSVRTLFVAGNNLTSVTAINHLLNLQYLDISRNDVDSVNPLSCLKHLRELKMDHNRVRDLTDIMSIDSLVKLSATNNALKGFDASRAKWSRLESLDISANQISELRGIERLPSLHTLNLDNNHLIELSVHQEMPTLRILRISNNKIPQINISDFPRLRTLYADGNRLEGLYRSNRSRMSKLEHLSLRNQGGRSLHLTYADLRDVKRLYISGNPMSPDFFPDQPLYSLIYFEAAACRLSAWPEDFAELIPNLRALNINYNFIDELDGLRGLRSLRKLSAVGTQLGQRGREGVMRAIRDLDALEEIDLRMNPCTLGFYLPLVFPGGTEVTALDPSHPNPNTPEGRWVRMDNTFRRSMPDIWYAKRLLYRGLLMEGCQGLSRLDGINITSAERAKARCIAEMAA